MNPSDERLPDRLAIGVMTWAFPPDMIKRAIQASGREGARNRLLSPQIMVYFVLTMCLFPDEGYEAVARRLAGGLALSGHHDLSVIPTTAAVSRARLRLGTEPLRALFADTAGRPPAGSPAPGTWYGQWRLWTLDGRTQQMPDGAVDIAVDGERDGERGGERGGLPGAESPPSSLQVTVLAEGGTGRLAAADITPITCSVGAVTRNMFRLLRRGDLLLADGWYASPDQFRMAVATGADLLWNIPESKLPLPPGDILPDGSYLSVLPGGPEDPQGAGAHAVRVIEDVHGRTRRLVTTILDPAAAPSSELRDIYERRWVFMQGVRQMNAFLGPRKKAMRSRSPAMIEQELWGHLLVYNAVCYLANKRIA